MSVTIIKSKMKGFTLIELMITLVIAAVLASIALPSYFQFVRESRRGDAITSLQQIIGQQALFYGNSSGGVYTNNVTNLGLVAVGGDTSRTMSQDNFYTLQLGQCDGGATPLTECVSVTATAGSGTAK